VVIIGFGLLAAAPLLSRAGFDRHPEAGVADGADLGEVEQALFPRLE
jgi:hypothetical protein